MTAATDTKPGPVFHGVEEIDDKRFYLIDDLRLMSVTTATGVVMKEALLPWAAGLAIEGAFAELPTVVVASRKKACENTWNRCTGENGHDRLERCERCPCGECIACISRWLTDRYVVSKRRRADEGKRVHDVAEWWSYTGEIKPHDLDIAPYVAAFEKFVADYGLTPESFLVSEALVVNRDDEYAGTTDGIIRFQAAATELAAKLVSRVTQVNWKRAAKQGLSVDLIGDFKTREGEGPKFYPEQALQVTGYRYAPVIRVKNSDLEEPMPATDGGILIQLRPDGYTPRLVVASEDTYRRGFLPALALSRWLIEAGNAAVSSHSFVLPETVRARERKAEKERAAAEAAADPSVEPQIPSETSEVA